MPADTVSWTLILLSFVATFVAARILGRRWRERRREREVQASRANESRQVRRARERQRR
ncbi:hypothetical protein [Ramlibacter sp.]|uniref:hypothetical protein n=1 Tax=Ramlibacter sp. TaxID=1917967 RepID=UPI003D0B8362